MVYFKACPRCQGDVTEHRDHYGTAMICIQCGWSKDIGPTTLDTLDDWRQAGHAARNYTYRNR